jgi:hypothetical protein
MAWGELESTPGPVNLIGRGDVFLRASEAGWRIPGCPLVSNIG